jgi:hypothetical protein
MTNQVMTKSLSNLFSTFTKVCVGFAILMAIFVFILFDLSKVFDPGPLTVAWLFLLGILIALSIASIIYIPFQIKRRSWKAFVPVLILLVLALSIPLLINIRMKIVLQVQKPEYEKIIKLVESGALQASSNNGYIQPAPPPSDFILVDKNSGAISIFFGTGFSISRGNYTGFVYRSDDTFPPMDIMNVNKIDCERYERFWYFCRSLY